MDIEPWAMAEPGPDMCKSAELSRYPGAIGKLNEILRATIRARARK